MFSWVEVEDRVANAGVDDVLASLRRAGSTDVGLQEQLRVLDLEAHHLRGWDRVTMPALLAQQVLARARAVGANELARAARAQIDEHRLPVLVERCRSNAPSPALRRTLPSEGAVADLAFGSDGKVYALVGSKIQVWDATTGLPASIPALPAAVHTRPTGSPAPHPHAIAVSGDGALLAVGYSDRRIEVLDLANGAVLATLAGHTEIITRLRFFEDGSRRLASASWDKTVRLWDVNRGVLAQTFLGHDQLVQDVVGSADGRTLVSGSDDATVRVWDTETGACRQILAGDTYHQVFGVALADGDCTLLACRDLGGVDRYTFENGYASERIALRMDQGGRDGYNRTRSIRPIGPGRALATNAAVIDILRTDPNQPGQYAFLTGHANEILVSAVSADGRLAATGDGSGFILIWDLTDVEADTGPPLGHYFDIREVAISPTGRLVVSSPGSMRQPSRIVAHDGDTGIERWRIEEEERPGPDVMWFTATSLVTAYGETAYLRSTASGDIEQATKMPGHVVCGHGERAVTVDGRGDRGYLLSIVSAHSGAVERTFGIPASSGYPGRASVTPDTSTVVWGATGILGAWRTATNELMSTRLPAQPTINHRPAAEAFVTTVAVDDEGCHALGVGAVGRAYLWDLQKDELTLIQDVRLQGWTTTAGLADHRAVTVGISGLAIVWNLTKAIPIAAAPLDSKLITVAVAEGYIAVGGHAGTIHTLVMTQGAPQPTPTSQPHTPQLATNTTQVAQQSFVTRLFRKP